MQKQLVCFTSCKIPAVSAVPPLGSLSWKQLIWEDMREMIS